MRILMLGDLFGRPGRKALKACLPELVERRGIDFTLVNVENAAGGKGMTPKIYDEILDMGVDVMTTGNHAWDKPEIRETFERSERLLRPLNDPKEMPGKGETILSARNGFKVGVINIMGRVHMKTKASPFSAVLEGISRLKASTPIVLVDFHAEATSEKRAMGFYLDGQVTAVVGTHTHVQTADEELLPQGTAYMSDLGMTGPHRSVIGMDLKKALPRFLQGEKSGFAVAKQDVRINGCVLDIDEHTGKARGIERLSLRMVDATQGA